jgi:hypothetical protein
VQFNLCARKDDAGPRTLANVVKSAGTEYAAAAFYPGLSYQVFADVRETDPATGAAWLFAAVNAVQAGPKVVS